MITEIKNSIFRVQKEGRKVRRLFIIRKDLHLTPGKLAAMVGHCCEAYWTNLLKAGLIEDLEYNVLPTERPGIPKLGVSPYTYYWRRYKHPKLRQLAEDAHNRGEKTFIAPKESPRKEYAIAIRIPKDIWNEYVYGIFTKTICEARNKNHLLKAEAIAKELNLVEGTDYGFINDKCLTELKPENEDGTTTVGMWFRPLPDDIAHAISKKFPLYRD